MRISSCDMKFPHETTPVEAKLNGSNQPKSMKTVQTAADE